MTLYFVLVIAILLAIGIAAHLAFKRMDDRFK